MKRSTIKTEPPTNCTIDAKWAGREVFVLSVLDINGVVLICDPESYTERLLPFAWFNEAELMDTGGEYERT